VIARSRLAVIGAVAILAAGVLFVVADSSDDPAPRSTPSTGSGTTPLVGAVGSAFASGRLAPDPGPAAFNIGTKGGGPSALEAIDLPSVDPCALLGADRVDSAMPSGWTAEPYLASGSRQCRWLSEAGATGGRDEIHLTLGSSALYRELELGEGSHRVEALGDDAMLLTRRSGGVVAVLDGKTTLVLAVSVENGRNQADITTLAKEALRAIDAAGRS
jgi:hypothetical protein